jgi:TetR/AcrR family transcriptional regulator, cholesterol catabolism regulator
MTGNLERLDGEDRLDRSLGGHTSRDSEPIGESKADQLLRLAARLFRLKGYAASTTRELASQLGIQKSSLYHHISGKEDLLFAISMKSLDHIITTVSTAASGAEPEQRLETIIIAHVETALQDQDMHTTMMIELRALSPDRRAQVLARRDQYQAILHDAVREGQAVGQLRTDVDAHYLTLSLLNLLNWTIFWYDVGGESSARDLAVMLSMIFLDGARVRPY